MNNDNNVTNENLNNSTRSNEKKGVRTIAVLLSAVFLLLTAGIGIFGAVFPDREFSESENRVLESMPALSWRSIVSGSFMKDFEAYLSDQFPFRDGAIELKTFADRLMGKREQNGVYIGDKGYLFDSQTDYVKKDNSAKLKAIDAFCNKYQKAKKLIAISPNSSYIYKEYLPYGHELPDQKVQISKVYNSLKSESLKKIDVTDILIKEKENSEDFSLFYKTDHHWTTRAAYSVFEQIGKQWSLGANKVNYEFHTVSDEFEGTLSGKAGVHDAKDTIEICIPEKSLEAYVVNYESQQRKTASVFDKSKLSQKNQYEVFLGGNFDKVIITTTSKKHDTLLIVKDSYANCMIPMFTPYFSKIVVVDPRYMTDSIETVMSDTDFTHVLFLYNLNTFLQDTSIVNTFEVKKK